MRPAPIKNIEQEGGTYELVDEDAPAWAEDERELVRDAMRAAVIKETDKEAERQLRG